MKKAWRLAPGKPIEEKEYCEKVYPVGGDSDPITAVFRDGDSLAIPNMTVAEYRAIMSSDSQRKSSVHYQAQHVSTHQRIQIAEKIDKDKLILALYDQNKMVISMRVADFASVTQVQKV